MFAATVDTVPSEWRRDALPILVPFSSYMRKCNALLDEYYFDPASGVCGPSVSRANERCTDRESDVDITLQECQ